MTLIRTILKAMMAVAGEKPSLDRMLEAMDRELRNLHTLVEPDVCAKPRSPFDSPHLTFDQTSMARFSLGQIISFLSVMIPLRVRMSQSASMYNGKYEIGKTEATPQFLADLENMARTAGAADIRFVRVPRNAIFQHKGIPHEYAVVITVEMAQDNIGTAPSFAAMREVAKGYGNLARICNRLAGFMRRNGFAAYPGTALGGLTDYPHIAEVAGLGAIGYHGMLITPNEGARVRINTIYTNITNLPVRTGNEHVWVRDFCAKCKKCIRGCPVQAIYEQPLPRGDGGMQCIDHAACRDYFNQEFGCAICLAKCPFSEQGYEKVRMRFKGNPNAPKYRIPVGRDAVLPAGEKE